MNISEYAEQDLRDVLTFLKKGHYKAAEIHLETLLRYLELI